MSVYTAFAVLLIGCCLSFVVGIAFRVYVDEQRAADARRRRFLRGDGP